MVVLVVVAAVITAVAAVVAVLFIRSGSDEHAAAPEWTTVTSGSAAEGPETDTVTVTASQDDAELDASGEPSDSSTGSDGDNARVQCDGRGVLIVSSVMGDSETFQPEVDRAIAANPGAFLVEPGYCPSLRATVDGTTVHPVVVDYGDDRAGLCSAAASVPGSNPRLLNDDTSYSSPC